MSAIRTLLVPIDFSEASHAALAYACNLATTVGARLHVLHVCEPPWTYSLAYTPPPAGSLEALATAAEARLARELEAVHAPVHTESMVRIGEPRAEILRYVNEELADLIVMGTHGWHGVERHRLGRVTRHVMHHARCPVLTLRTDVKSEPRPADADGGMQVAHES
jgi:nucleotide-binding universal stress UspA family protein